MRTPTEALMCMAVSLLAATSLGLNVAGLLAASPAYKHRWVEL